MVWSQFSIKILGVHFGNSVLDNSSWDKISHSLPEKITISNRVQLSFGWKKRIVDQILLSKGWYTGQIDTISKLCGRGILDIATQLNSLEL